MVASPTISETIDARRVALESLDPLVRGCLAEVAPAWGLAGNSSIELTAYDSTGSVIVVPGPDGADMPLQGVVKMIIDPPPPPTP